MSNHNTRIITRTAHFDASADFPMATANGEAPCEICHGKRFGPMCLFIGKAGRDLCIHPACGKNPAHPLHILSANGLRKRFGNKAAVARVFESGNVRSACGPSRFGNPSEMYIVAEFVAALSEEGYFAAEAAKKKRGPSNPYLSLIHI